MIINWDHYPEIFLKTKIFPSSLKEKSNSSKTEEELISHNFCQNPNKKLLGRNKLKVIIFLFLGSSELVERTKQMLTKIQIQIEKKKE